MKRQNKHEDFSKFMRPTFFPTTTVRVSISTCNIVTIWDTGKTSQLTTKMRRYELGSIRITENHLIQAEQQRLYTGEMLPYINREKKIVPEAQSAARILSREAQNALVGWKPNGAVQRSSK